MIHPLGRPLHVLDLCSGTGAATRAFEERGHSVVRLDISRELGDPHILGDIRQLPIRPDARFDFIWCSPPCQQFSMRSARAKGKEPKAYSLQGEPDMSLVLACKAAIDLLHPRWWLIENVQGAVRYFEPILGRGSRWGAWYWWGELPLLCVDPGSPRKGMGLIFASKKHGKHWHGQAKSNRQWANHVHPSISLSLCLSMEASHG